MEQTEILGLKKPEYTDIADIADINDNMDTIDAAVDALQKKIQYGSGTPQNPVTGTIWLKPRG